MAFVALYIHDPNQSSFIEKIGADVFYEIIERKRTLSLGVIDVDVGVLLQHAHTSQCHSANSHREGLARLYGVG